MGRAEWGTGTRRLRLHAVPASQLEVFCVGRAEPRRGRLSSTMSGGMQAFDSVPEEQES